MEIITEAIVTMATVNVGGETYTSTLMHGRRKGEVNLTLIGIRLRSV